MDANAVTSAQQYGQTVLLYSEEQLEVGGVYGAPPGPSGYCWTIPAGKPVRVPYEVKRYIAEHLPNSGVVEVTVSETRDEFGNVTGTKFDLPSAKAASQRKLAEGDDNAFRTWLSNTIEDFVKRSKPVPEPPEHIMTILQRRGYDLKKYGITPVGWAEREKADSMQEMRNEIAQLRRALAEQAASVNPAATVPPPVAAKGK